MSRELIEELRAIESIMTNTNENRENFNNFVNWNFENVFI